MNGIAAIIVAYLVGGIPFGFLLVKWKTGKDVRASGSGNIGATNVLRTTGRAIGIATLLLDIGKGTFAVWLADYFTSGDPAWMSAAALAVMAGHAFPIFLKFKGGKAVASFTGAFAYLTPLPMLAIAIVFIIIVAATRHISAGSVVCAGMFPFGVWMILHPPAAVLIAAFAGGAFIIYRHKANIARLREGTESAFAWKKR